MTKFYYKVWVCAAFISSACADVADTDDVVASRDALTASSEAAGTAALAVSDEQEAQAARSGVSLPGTRGRAPDALLESCHGSAVSISANRVPGGGVFIWPASGTKRTTSNCRDINVRLNRAASVSACVYYSSDPTCTAYRSVQGSEWAVIEPSVPNGTRFYLAFRTYVDGQAAF